MLVRLPAGVTTGIGSLPHTSAAAAAECVLDLLPELPAIPSLPARSPAEGMLAQALVGVQGIDVRADGHVEVHVGRLDPAIPVVTDLEHEAFGGLRGFLEVAKDRRAPVKWQLTGPLTLGLWLVRKGVPPPLAFDVAGRAVGERLRTVQAAVTEALPACPQVVFLDEPGMTTLLHPEFPLAPESAVDLVSGALATVEPAAMVGVHHCGNGDWAAIMATGPAVLSLPVRPDLVEVAGFLASFLDGGGWIAWGAVRTDGPVATAADRSWRELADLWCSLVQAGCHPVKLRSQAMVTPACGLALHSQPQAERVLRLVDQVADRVRAQALATRLSVGA